MFSFLSEVAELNQTAALTAAGRRLSKVLSSLCGPLTHRTCVPACLSASVLSISYQVVIE